MKKKLVVFAVVVFVTGLFLSSCKSQPHSCPAYSQANPTHTVKNV